LPETNRDYATVQEVTMATLVTGGTGFVGSNIVMTLAKKGHSVICLDLAAPSPLVKGYLDPWLSQMTFVQGDILDQENIARAAASGVDKIVHAAVFTGILPEIERERSRSIVEINLMGTTNLLELARTMSVDRFVYVSSGSVYGDDAGLDEVLHEDAPPNPRSLYAIGKYTSELLTRRYGELHGFQTANVRLGGPYGPMERVTGHRANQSLLKEWTGNVVRDEPIQVGDQNVKRSFTYVADIAAGVCAVLDAPTLSYDVYNNSSAEWTTMAEVVAVLHDLRPNLRTIDVSQHDLSGRASRMDVTRIMEDVGFVAQFDLAAGLREYLAWREHTGFTE
jgi:UDP-glucose 4-epimerase